MRISSLLLAAALAIALALPAAADYPMFGLDPGRTGNASGDAPLANMRLWETHLSPNGGGYIGGGASVLGDRVYVSNWPDMDSENSEILGLYSLDKSDGSIIWNNSLGGNGGVSTPAVAGDRVFAGSVGPYGAPGPDDPTTGDLYCINTTNGITLWNKPIESNPGWFGAASSPLIYDGAVYVVSSSDGKLHAFDFDGNKLWDYAASGGSDIFMSATTDGSRIFFGGGNAMNCVDIATQSEEWTFGVGSQVSTTPTVEDGVVYFATGRGEKKLYAVDIATGNEIWNRSLYGSLSSPAISNGRIYIGDKDKRLNCINATDGSEIWNQTLEGACRSSPVVAGGMVYTAANSVEGTIYCFDADDGTLKWSYDPGNYNMAQPSVSDGTLFVGSDTGYLYAFGIWKGNTVLLKGETLNVTADTSNTNYTISRTTALGAFVKTARREGFDFTINDSDYAANGTLFIDSIVGVSNDVAEGNYWHYWVNYPNSSKPDRGANEYELDGTSDARDVVMFYYGGATSTPVDAVMGVEITTQIIEKKPEAIFITVERLDFIENTAERSNLNITLLHPSEVLSRIDLRGYDLVFLEHIGGTAAKNLEDPVKAANTAGIDIICIHSEGYDGEFGNANLTSEHPFILQYWDNYDEGNIARLLTYLEVTFCGLIGDVKDPIPIPKAYIFHPDVSELFLDTAKYLEWYGNETRSGYRYNPDNLTIGFANWFESVGSADVPELIHTLEEKGTNVIPLSMRDTGDINRFYIVNNETVVDSVISAKSFRINFDDPDQGVRDLEILNVPVMRALRLYYMAPAAWRNETSHGISIMDLGFQVGLPEMDGIIDPIVIAGKNESDSKYQPIDAQINWTCDRAIGWAHLNSTPNAKKRIAMIYYNHGGGKDNLGACYVNVPPSLQNILNAMNRSGYTVEGEIPNETELVRMMTLNGTNIGTWAPGELERLVASGTATLIPVETYLGWFGKLDDERQKEVNKRWGEPPGEIMTWENDTGKYFVIPTLPFGNVSLTPQPTRGWLQNNTVLYHNRDVPPHHQYIAFYLWLGQDRESGGFGADEIMHFGKHGTQEWLPGKESGLSSEDCWPAILIQDIPVIYPYIVDNIAEGTQAKRRGSATMITHLTPPIVAAGLYGNLTNLLETVSFYMAPDVNSTVKGGYKKTIISECEELHLDDDLEVNLTTMDDALFDDFAMKLAGYLYDLKTEFMPYGLHTFGEPPEGEPEVSFVISMLRDGYKAEVARMIGYNDYPNPLRIDKEEELDNCTTQLIDEVINGTEVIKAQEIVLNQSSDELTTYLNRALGFSGNLANCTIEVPRTLRGFDGGYIPPSTADDPIRDPSALPTGRNFYSMNPRAIPTEEAWQTGQEMADALIERYQADHGGEYPKKLTVVLWAWAMTDQGVVESEILHLVGAKPVWDSYGAVHDVELVNASELSTPGEPGKFGRPRIDVMVVPSGLHRDVFPGKLKLIDRAIRLAENATPEQDCGHPNYVKNNTLEILDKLKKTGRYSKAALEENATYLSVSRIFLEAPGTYGPNLDSVIAASGTWNNSSTIGKTFITRMHYIYGDEVWGIPGEEVFKFNLEQADAIVFNMNSNLYGLIDNDDVFQYVGGLASAYKAITGDDISDVYVTDNRDPDKTPEVSSLGEVIRRELRTRYLNPTWIEGMMGEGYAGAREMTKFVEYLWGWEATMSELITDDMWQGVYDVYVGDAYSGEYRIDIGKFASEHNPYAYQSMTARMLEAIRHGSWTPSADVFDDVLKTLVSEHLESVVQANGPCCCVNCCGNPLLDDYIAGLISQFSISPELAEKYMEIRDDAAGRTRVSSDSGGSSSSRDGTHPPEQDKTSTRSHTSSTASNETTTEGGVGTNVDQPMNPSKQSESNYVEGSEMEVEKSEKFNTGLSFSGAPMLGMILVIALMVIIYWGYRRRR
ncbi:MAG: cobaltochelatase subunit CobN [Euryarchaeota archaeon]|nr:cobaltochelatase subunit CobN [Euryarchaeota archaeon]